MPLFQIHLDDNANNRKIFELKDLLYQWVVVEDYRRPTRTVQCYRCQYFHHTSQNCRLEPRCNKCDTTGHEYKDCPKGSGKIDSVTCCNCKQVGHPANYRGCPKFPENVKKAALNSKSSLVNKNKSFSSLFTTPSPQNSNVNKEQSFIPTVFRQTPPPPPSHSFI